MLLALQAILPSFSTCSHTCSFPHDAGDFSLMDRRVVKACLRFPERDLFLRGVRAYAGFKQVGVDYVRPKRMFGRTTNSTVQEHRMGEEGYSVIFQCPIEHAELLRSGAVRHQCPVALTQIVLKLLFPEMAPAGLTTVLVLIAFFGALNLLR